MVPASMDGGSRDAEREQILARMRARTAAAEGAAAYFETLLSARRR